MLLFLISTVSKLISSVLFTHRGSCLPLIALNYTEGILLGPVYFREALGHLRSLRLSKFLQDIVSTTWVLLAYIWCVRTVVVMTRSQLGRKSGWNCTRSQCAILNKSWKQQPTKQQQFGHLPPISQTI